MLILTYVSHCKDGGRHIYCAQQLAPVRSGEGLGIFTLAVQATSLTGPKPVVAKATRPLLLQLTWTKTPPPTEQLCGGATFVTPKYNHGTAVMPIV
jgi:hypothetical protein